MDFKATLKSYQGRIEDGIKQWVPSSETAPPHLHEAMLYSLEAGGKRLRPVLILAVAELFEVELDPLPAAIAIECIHTYSLIHDDLPSIDNSDLRRGKPTCHKQFDEPTALLAGDALLTIAFEILSRAYQKHPVLANQLVLELSTASGSQKLIGGQMEDILGENSDYSKEQLDYIHLNKTAALIAVAMTMGAHLGQASEEELKNIRTIGTEVGLAFQITDDILDATSDSDTMGKPTGADAENEKTTYIKLFGLEGARQEARKHTALASEICASLNQDTAFLEALIEYLEHRIN
ncbi:polyprenyl synthetase family protein [Opitutia bacterium ISCC 51]|nr:polyprenyl synthetase family protein [Opitutae bacterium ISCC 51]QXD27029.1 polyprenyl synthetase family protein [Opitutae bacterium ISCC 52]